MKGHGTTKNYDRYILPVVYCHSEILFVITLKRDELVYMTKPKYSVYYRNQKTLSVIKGLEFTRRVFLLMS